MLVQQRVQLRQSQKDASSGYHGYVEGDNRIKFPAVESTTAASTSIHWYMNVDKHWTLEIAAA